MKISNGIVIGLMWLVSTAAFADNVNGPRTLTCQQAQGDYPKPVVQVKVSFVKGGFKGVLSRDPYGFQYGFSPRYDGDDTVIMQAYKGGAWGIFFCSGALY